MSNYKGRSCTVRQRAYAMKVFGGQGESKEQMALDSGYSPAVARSVVTHIESLPGFQNAMAELAHESNNLAMEVMHKLKARGFEDFSNKEMIQALTAISNAWQKFTEPVKNSTRPSSGNKLRTVILKQLEVQDASPQKEEKKKEEKPNLDF